MPEFEPRKTQRKKPHSHYSHSLCSAFDVLAIGHPAVTLAAMAQTEPALTELATDPALCGRLQVEAAYAAAVEDQLREVEEVRREEALRLPSHIDYSCKQLNLGFEEREKLSMAQPQTVSFIIKIKTRKLLVEYLSENLGEMRGNFGQEVGTLLSCIPLGNASESNMFCTSIRYSIKARERVTSGQKLPRISPRFSEEHFSMEYSGVSTCTMLSFYPI